MVVAAAKSCLSFSMHGITCPVQGFLGVFHPCQSHLTWNARVNSSKSSAPMPPLAMGEQLLALIASARDRERGHTALYITVARTLASSHCSSRREIDLPRHRRNGAPPAGPRAPRRLRRRAAATDAVAAGSQRAAVQYPAADAPVTDHASPCTAGADHPSSGSHHAASGTDHATPGAHHPAAVSPGDAPARSHHATPVAAVAASSGPRHPAAVSPGDAPARSGHPAPVPAPGASSRNASSPGDASAGAGARAHPVHRPDGRPHHGADRLPDQPQDARPHRGHTLAVALPHRHPDDRQLRRHDDRARGRRRRARGIGGRHLALSLRVVSLLLSFLLYHS
ncbi:uncharacterized protein LOC127762620 [Oryza glaberrima]|uniref:uncharacterized protein LOC127762620 n=1 Tax=Oryza glaberrima TaxID=4538 RepID=UPI00224C6289|nr:uncharacterized protein LOC127762620 [Oryza glaberrima]